MITACKDCAHVEVCGKCIMWQKFPELCNVENLATCCDFFTDCSRFVELPCAEWIEDEDMYGDPIYRCSNCNEHFVLEEGTPTDNCYSYCPNCGAKMEVQALKGV